MGLFLVAFFSLLSSWQLLVKNVQFDLSFVGKDEVTVNEKRFEGVRKSLPSHGIVGYWPNGQPTTYEQMIFGNATDLQHWFLTQYALAPVIVSPTPGHDLIIGNYRSYVGYELLGKNPTMNGRIAEADKVTDFGNGILLLSREPK